MISQLINNDTLLMLLKHETYPESIKYKDTRELCVQEFYWNNDLHAKYDLLNYIRQLILFYIPNLLPHSEIFPSSHFRLSICNVLCWVWTVSPPASICCLCPAMCLLLTQIMLDILTSEIHCRWTQNHCWSCSSYCLHHMLFSFGSTLVFKRPMHLWCWC